MYIINFGTGAGNITVDSNDLAEALSIADKGAAYTQTNIVIYDENGNEIARRNWNGVEYDENSEDYVCENPILFGRFGFYSDWQIEE